MRIVDPHEGIGVVVTGNGMSITGIGNNIIVATTVSPIITPAISIMCGRQNCHCRKIQCENCREYYCDSIYRHSWIGEDLCDLCCDRTMSCHYADMSAEDNDFASYAFGPY